MLMHAYGFQSPPNSLSCFCAHNMVWADGPSYGQKGICPQTRKIEPSENVIEKPRPKHIGNLTQSWPGMLQRAIESGLKWELLFSVSQPILMILSNQDEHIIYNRVNTYWYKENSSDLFEALFMKVPMFIFSIQNRLISLKVNSAINHRWFIRSLY